ncbi:MAG TPA: serine--tRNA ligase [Candidatus Babeliales bacterium]|nr:serine--tRNA ligase [Candidatus Babeliales bacterium]
MIDLGLLREHPDQIIKLLTIKEPSFDAQLLLKKDQELRTMRSRVEELRHQKNQLAANAKSGITPEIRERSIALGTELKQTEKELEVLEKEFNELYLRCPNIPSTDIPLGGKESNKVVRQEGGKPTFSFPAKNHIDLATALGWLDFASAAKITGSNFALYRGDGVKMIYALSMFMLKHNQEHGFQMILPPYLINEESLRVAGNFPKFKDQVYATENDPLFLIPTAEVSLTNLYRDHIFEPTDLPMRLTSWTSCFRREAGSYGANERGLIRIHQFEKVELYTFTRPEYADQELDRIVACAEGLLKKLGLHYRISLLAGQDCSFQSAKTFDIEVWIPSLNDYKEVSSCSNCTDFQARRGMIRYREAAGEKTKLVYTLNGSSLALPRLMVAIMETYQQADGSIAIPDILKNYGVW